MELLTPAFVILLVKITLCVLPGVFGIYLLVLSDERKRALRNSICNRLFGVNHAIPLPYFERALLVVAILAILLCAVAAWFLLLAGML